MCVQSLYFSLFKEIIPMRILSQNGVQSCAYHSCLEPPLVPLPCVSSYTYLSWWHVWRHGVYSLVLTKAAFFHRDFLHAYAGVPPSLLKPRPASAASPLSELAAAAAASGNPPARRAFAASPGSVMHRVHDYVDEVKKPRVLMEVRTPLLT
jgi:hypothetical protein